MTMPTRDARILTPQRLKSALWDSPDGLVWRLTERATITSRRGKFEMLMNILKPEVSTTILDVGISGFSGRATDFLELWYPWPEQITAVGHGETSEFASFRAIHPKVSLVLADGRNLPFDDQAFDIVFANAVLEHVGSRDEQARFISECLRVGRRIFLTTPDPACPIDSHTLLPFVHWLPYPWRCWVYRRAGRAYWASEQQLNLVSRRQISGILPDGAHYQIIRQSRLCVPTVLILLARRTPAV